MARIPERKFDPAQPVIARKYFTSNGRKYAPGDMLDWRKNAIPQRRVMQMFDAGKLMHGDLVEEYSPEVISEEYDLKAIEKEVSKIEGYVPNDDLESIDDMKELRRIADAEGASYKVSKADQRQAIRDNRKEVSE